MSSEFRERERPQVMRVLLLCASSLLLLAAAGLGVSCNGDDGPTDEELQALLEQMVLTQDDIPEGLVRTSVTFSTNEDLAEGPDFEAELEKLEDQGRQMGIDVNYLPGEDVPEDFVLAGGVQMTASLYRNEEGASESFQEGVEGARAMDPAELYTDLYQVESGEIERSVGDESLWLRVTGRTGDGNLLVDDQIAFRQGRARGFVRVISIHESGTERDVYMDEAQALAELATQRIDEALSSSD